MTGADRARGSTGGVGSGGGACFVAGFLFAGLPLRFLDDLARFLGVRFLGVFLGVRLVFSTRANKEFQQFVWLEKGHPKPSESDCHGKLVIIFDTKHLQSTFL